MAAVIAAARGGFNWRRHEFIDCSMRLRYHQPQGSRKEFADERCEELDRNDAAHAEHSARLSIIDKQLAALTRDVRDMRGGVTRQLTGQDQRLAALEQRQQAFETTMTQRLDGVDAQLARVIAMLETR